MTTLPDLNKTLPHDELAERAIIGAMLSDNYYISEVFSQITPDDFFKNSHKIISAAVNKISNSNEAADIITVSGTFSKKELKFIGGFEYLNSLVDGVPDNINISEYIETVKDRSILRKLIISSLGIISRGIEPNADTTDILSGLQEEIIKIAGLELSEGFVPANEIVSKAVEKIEKIQKSGESGGLNTDFYELDSMTSGFQPSDLIVIAARPSMGKTALALNIATNMVLKEGKSVGFFSIEMSRTQIMMRLLASEARINMSALMAGRPHLNQKEWSDLELAATKFGKANLFIDDSASLSILEMKTRARRLHKQKKLDVIFVDYLQLIKAGNENIRKNDTRAQEVALITASLKELAKELEIPVVALAQLNRAPEQRGSKKGEGPRYQLSDLKESGSIEQDADVVMFLHREEQVDRDTERKGEADLIIAKQRNGPTGKIVLAFMDKYTKFANMEYSPVD